MKLNLNDGDAFVEGRSPAKARELLKKASDAGLESSTVRTAFNGYIVPKELVEESTGESTEDKGQDEVPVTPETPTEPEETATPEANAFDPADHSVAEVEAYLETADETERQRVLAAETEGKNRKSLLPEDETEGAK